jgi:hypothetical protein
LALKDDFSYQKQDILDLKVKIKFNVIAYKRWNDTLYYLYNAGDSIAVLAIFKLDGVSASKLGSKVIAASKQESAKYFPLACDKDGFFIYDKANKLMVYNRYDSYQIDY